MSKFLDLTGLSHFLSKIKTWTNEQLDKYLPLTAGPTKPLTGTLHSSHITPTSTNSCNVGTSSLHYANGYFTNLTDNNSIKYAKLSDIHNDGNAKTRVQIGINSSATANHGVAVGNGATALGYGISLGYNAIAKTASCVTIGYSTDVTGTGAIGIGRGAVTNGNYSITLGYNAKTEGTNSIAIGYGTNGSAQSALAIGLSATSAAQSVAIGRNTSSTGISSVVIGYDAAGSQASVVAIGHGAKGNGAYSVVLGKSASAFAAGVAIGEEASSYTNAIALGANSKVTEADSAGAGDNNSYRPLSVGNTSEPLAKRRIINVKDGYNDNDAATVGQLKNAGNYIDLSGYTKNTEIWPDTNKQKVQIGGTSTGTYGVTLGYNTTTGNYSVTVGGAATSGTYGVAVGRSANAANYSTVLGYGAAANLTYGGAIGYNSQLLETDLDSNDHANYRPISVGRSAGNYRRRIINVRAGVKDGDAVNVKQLNEAISSVNASYGLIFSNTNSYGFSNNSQYETDKKNKSNRVGNITTDLKNIKVGEYWICPVLVNKGKDNEKRGSYIFKVMNKTDSELTSQLVHWIDPVL